MCKMWARSSSKRACRVPQQNRDGFALMQVWARTHFKIRQLRSTQRHQTLESRGIMNAGETKRYTVIEHNNGGSDMWVIWDTTIEKICSHGYQDLAYANEICATMNANDPQTLKQLIAEQAAEIAQMKGGIETAIERLRSYQDDWQHFSIAYIRKELMDVLSSQAPAPLANEAVSEVTLSEGDFPNHDADDFTKADLEFFARQDNPEKFWYYEELSPRQKAAIASRRKALGLA
jgi:hypothetical protein